MKILYNQKICDNIIIFNSTYYIGNLIIQSHCRMLGYNSTC